MQALLATFGAPSLALASATAKRREPQSPGRRHDLYAWFAPDAKLASPSSATGSDAGNGGPNFYAFDDDAYYWINVDSIGDAQDHIAICSFRTEQLYRTRSSTTSAVASLTDPDLNVRQFCTVTRYDGSGPTVLATDVPVAPNFVGPVSMPDYSSLAKAAVTKLPDGSKLFIGPRDDPFFVDLAAIFDLLTIRKVPGNRGKGVDGLGGFNVLSIAIQIPRRG
jgi:hypothetical protein